MSEAKKTCNAIGWRYAVFAVVTIGVELLAAVIFRAAAPDWTEAHPTLLQYILILIAVECIGFPLIYFLTRGMEKFPLPRTKLGAGRYLTGLFMCFTIMIAGNLIGTLFQLLITGSTNNVVTDLISSGSDDLMRVLVIGICAPIFEELIFRKFLIDHLAGRGIFLSILTSGLFFGLFHGNFAQFFYAAGLGLLFAYVYVKTGKIGYSISYHMIINLASSVIAAKALELASAEQAAGAQIGTGTILFGLYSICVYSFAIVGLILFILNFKKFSCDEQVDETTGVRGKAAWKVFFTSAGVWVYIVVCALLFVYGYVSIALS